jgi:hypothetical protein
MKRQACARSQSLQSHSLLYPYPLLERTPLGGAPITRTSGSKEAEPIAVFIRSGNAWLCFGSMAADFAHKIHIGLAGTLKPGIREGIISAPEGPLTDNSREVFESISVSNVEELLGKSPGKVGGIGERSSTVEPR